jgi:L-fuconolactonase
MACLYKILWTKPVSSEATVAVLTSQKPLFVVDAQVHVWKCHRSGSNSTTGGHRAAPLLPCDLIAEMDQAGVSRAVLIPPTWEANNDLALAAATSHPGRFGVMGRLALRDRESHPALQRWRENPHMLGLRANFNRPDDREALHDGTADWAWPVAERCQIPLMLHAPRDLATIGTIASRYPDLAIVIDHMAISGNAAGSAAFVHLPELLALARYPRVGVKVSGLPCAASDPYPYRNVHGYLRRVVDAFGPERLFWASDFTRLPCSYGEAVSMFTEAIPWLSGCDLAWIMGKSIMNWLRWPSTPQVAGHIG